MTDITTDPRLLLLAPDDTVYVLRAQIDAGETVLVEGRAVTVPHRLGLGHKIARQPVAPGGKVVKYGAPIGSASHAIAPGDHVHTHNLQSDYTPTYSLDSAQAHTSGSTG
ncbi:UxaA family hydrolase [Roseinatronobacter alkalisoli]|uniref:UxaA family hydrolase n=1 Tax=Roseinatronobacter alkalisoli TaxID=3028235 RepID=A0ABT5T869_9RHOB|nr:UxaA family hydrolase [Roseinatronobacter sp. HJB301]MDD7970895.1 UxaA family hydrolase [Roseinatronobacter sp. HJB301]